MPRDVATLESAEIGSVLVGATLPTMAPFFVILGSVATRASQTALLVIPTLVAALVATLSTAPAALAWHTEARPRAHLVPTTAERIVAHVQEAHERVTERRISP